MWLRNLSRSLQRPPVVLTFYPNNSVGSSSAQPVPLHIGPPPLPLSNLCWFTWWHDSLTLAKAFHAFDKSKFAAKPTVPSSKVLVEENKTNLAYCQNEPQRVDYSLILLQKENVCQGTWSRKLWSPLQTVPGLYTHFDLEDSLWEEEDDDCDLTSFSSLTFLLSWSFSASPYYCITLNCYEHNCTDKIEGKNTQQRQWEQWDLREHLHAHGNL